MLRRGSVAITASVVCARRALAGAESAPAGSLHPLSGTKLDGTRLPLASLAGKPALLLNVASH